MSSPSSIRTHSGPSGFPPATVLSRVAAAAPRVAPTLSPTLDHWPPVTSAVTAQPARPRTLASPAPEPTDAIARAREAGLPAAWFSPPPAATTFPPLPLARRSTAEARIDRRASDQPSASATPASSAMVSAAPLPAPPVAARAETAGETGTTAESAANGGEDLEGLTDRVYDRLMERLRIERESLGL